jgi:hypothetical protein
MHSRWICQNRGTPGVNSFVDAHGQQRGCWRQSIYRDFRQLITQIQKSVGIAQLICFFASSKHRGIFLFAHVVIACCIPPFTSNRRRFCHKVFQVNAMHDRQGETPQSEGVDFIDKLSEYRLWLDSQCLEFTSKFMATRFVISGILRSREHHGRAYLRCNFGQAIAASS